MEEDRDILAIARALVERFGTEATNVGEERARGHRRAQESEGAEFWQRIADAARMILSSQPRKS